MPVCHPSPRQRTGLGGCLGPQQSPGLGQGVWSSPQVPDPPGWPVPHPGESAMMLWQAVKAARPGASCSISIPQTGALLDLDPGTGYFHLFLLVYASPGGARIPLQVNLTLLTGTLIFLVVFFRATLSQQESVTTEQSETAAAGTPASSSLCHQALAAAGTWSRADGGT